MQKGTVCGRARRALFVAAALAIPSVVMPAAATAANNSWTFAGSGNWSLAGNWLGGLPAVSANITIAHADAINRTITFDVVGAPAFNQMLVDNTGTGSDLFSQSANTFSIGSETIGNAGSGYWTVAGGTHSVTATGASGLTFGSLATGKGTGTLSAGTLNAAAGEVFLGFHGAGTFNQTGGTLNAASITLGAQSDGIGTFNLTAGTLNANIENIGDLGSGTFHQTLGKHFVGTAALPGTLSIGGTDIGGAGAGTYLLNGTGSLTVLGHEFVGDEHAGTFIQSSGLHTVGSQSNFGLLVIGSDLAAGNYSLSGAGELDVLGQEEIGNNTSGTFNQTGGTHNAGSDTLFTQFDVGAPSGTGTYLISGNSTLNVIGSANVGLLGNGTINQSGGTVTIGSDLTGTDLSIGAAGAGNSGNYLLSAGTLTVFGQEEIGSGESTTGVFTQSGGLHTIGSASQGGRLIVGEFGAGTYTLNAGTLNDLGDEFIGQSAPGTFVQTGGVHYANVAPSVFDIGRASDGTYSLSGTGLLSVIGTERVGVFGAGTFFQNGGTHQVTDLSVGGNTGAGTYIFSAGVLSGGSVEIKSNGTFNANAAGILNANFVLEGGTVTGVLRSQGSFTYSSGTFSGELLNQGYANLGTLFTAVGGIENDGTITVSSPQQITANGVGWDNFGTLTLVNGALNGLSVTNEFSGVMSGVGTITPAFTNRGNVNASGQIFASATTNNGAINLPAGSAFHPASIANFGAINLTGGALTGSGAVTNNAGGVIEGGGQVQMPIIPGGGVISANNPTLPLSISAAMSPNTFASQIIVAANCDLDVTDAFSNAGVITLQGGSAFLFGGTITNTGTIKGAGQIGNSIANTGTIRAENGELDLTGGATNASPGQIVAGAGTVMLTLGLANNSGTISLAGGAFDNSGGALSNSGNIAGRGTIRSGTITNSGTMNFSAGLSDVFAPITNTGRISVTGGSTTTLYSAVTTSVGSINVNTASTVVFAGTLTGQSHVSGPGLKDFEGTASGGPIVSMVGDTLVGPSGSVSADYLRENNVSIFGLLALLPDGTPAHVSTMNTLTITGGTFDLTDNDLIVNNTPVSTIAAYIAQAYNGGNWNGPGLTSSSAQASALGAHKTALGYATASSINASVFDGQSVSGANLLVRYVYSGDANLDGVVNALDFNAVATNFGAVSGKFWNQGDFNYDGITNTLDFNNLAVNFNLALASPPALGSPVPEPVFCVVPALLALMARRRGNRT